MPTHYVALGDSAGAGFGVPAGAGYVDRVYARLQQRDASARLLNLARKGATTETLRADQVDAALGARPTVCSLFIGGNDLWRGVTPSHYGRNLEAIADRLDRARCPVVVGTLPNLSHAPAAALAERFLGIARAQIEERIVAYNERVRRLAVDHGYALVDLFGATRLDEHAEYFAADGFHPSAAGHAAWYEAIWPAFAGLDPH
ncbi:SGNH/GDSL hydrolase family protein [Nannocystis pusilla]|uniref:SGNH/GDSL hydrolase family protein n=1 Tax=Nannocystis pusilla TaxID=889268 RepID=A0ABS7U011_9BACT|nr:SGNH/GDSL hydrolase family protein [Nannocystis pusilla]